MPTREEAREGLEGAVKALYNGLEDLRCEHLDKVYAARVYLQADGDGKAGRIAKLEASLTEHGATIERLRVKRDDYMEKLVVMIGLRDGAEARATEAEEAEKAAENELVHMHGKDLLAENARLRSVLLRLAYGEDEGSK